MGNTTNQRPRTLQGDTNKEKVHCTDSIVVILNRDNSQKNVFSKIHSALEAAHV